MFKEGRLIVCILIICVFFNNIADSSNLFVLSTALSCDAIQPLFCQSKADSTAKLANGMEYQIARHGMGWGVRHRFLMGHIFNWTEVIRWAQLLTALTMLPTGRADKDRPTPQSAARESKNRLLHASAVERSRILPRGTT